MSESAGLSIKSLASKKTNTVSADVTVSKNQIKFFFYKTLLSNRSVKIQNDIRTSYSRTYVLKKLIIAHKIEKWREAYFSFISCCINSSF